MTTSKKMLQLGQNKRKETREPLFTLDGVEYSVLMNPGPNIGLTFMAIQAESGQEAAIVYLLKAMLGEEAFKALAASPDVTEDEYAALMAEISERAMAAQEKPVKNS
jgi:hypothetical protein